MAPPSPRTGILATQRCSRGVTVDGGGGGEGGGRGSGSSRCRVNRGDATTLPHAQSLFPQHLGLGERGGTVAGTKLRPSTLPGPPP